ncbi:helix-turn-helix transcriptional regulator [Actinomycetospora lutea]|uniref:helix-turn-helix domain-containing protein n=1 Tax=Actinomycetospora lutea TaxID=663604 RepID=UPI002366A44B|nr:helix-turn-helix transcriptional regulator [Actinomycetospora lutea]MDD7941523.1 helix-turn-helix transcriptional regulator [Actinomycetospora lutea]
MTAWPSAVYRVQTDTGTGGAGDTPDPGGGSMTWSPGPVVTRRRLGGELKRLREGAGLKLEDVARKLECSPSKISRLENGKGVPRWRDVRDMLEVYGVPEGDERERFLDWAKSGQARMWWSSYRDVMPPAMATYVELEWDARGLTAYEPHIVHGLLQTRDYARAVLQANYGSHSSSHAIERLVEVRMRRQEALAAGHGLSFACVLDESTLHRVVGSPRVQREQVEHLIAVAEAEHVEVRVLPYSAGLLPSSRDSFAKLEFSEPDVDDVVWLEQPGPAGEFFAAADDVEDRIARLAAIHRASLPEKDSVALMKDAVRRIGDL